MSEFRQELFGQPEMVAKLIEAEQDNVKRVAGELNSRGFQQFVISARGRGETSAQAYGKYLFDTLNRYVVAFAPPSVYTLYHMPQRLESALVLSLSQSDEPDQVEVISEARRQGGLTVAVTRNPESSLAKSAEYVILTHSGQDLSGTTITACVAQQVVLAMLSAALGEDDERLTSVRALPPAMAKILTLEATTRQAAEQSRDIKYAASVGRGYNYASALEIGNELKEFTYTFADATSSADFVRGPISMVAQGFPVILVAPKGRVYPPMCQVGQDLRKRNAKLTVISDGDEILDLADATIRLPVSVEEWLSPLISVLAGQLFTYHLALAKGHEPGQPGH